MPTISNGGTVDGAFLCMHPPSQQQAAVGRRTAQRGADRRAPPGAVRGLDGYMLAHTANLYGVSCCAVGFPLLARLVSHRFVAPTGSAQGWGLSLARPELLVLCGLLRRECKGVGCGSAGTWLGTE